MQSFEIDQQRQQTPMTAAAAAAATTPPRVQVPQLSLQRKPISDPSVLPKKKSQIAGACSNLINSIVGAGIIGT